MVSSKKSMSISRSRVASRCKSSSSGASFILKKVQEVSGSCTVSSRCKLKIELYDLGKKATIVRNGTRRIENGYRLTSIDNLCGYKDVYIMASLELSAGYESARCGIMKNSNGDYILDFMD